jgi:hypothetical protein
LDSVDLNPGRAAKLKLMLLDATSRTTASSRSRKL